MGVTKKPFVDKLHIFRFDVKYNKKRYLFSLDNFRLTKV